MAVNVVAVVSLMWTEHLLGVRGGHRACAAERHTESLPEVERAAVDDSVETSSSP